MKTEWNYTELAKSYLNRPNYAPIALSNMLTKMQMPSRANVCDIGAGVAHLTIPLLEQGYIVDAVEPNDAMRELGKMRTHNYKAVAWHEGTGERTGMKDDTYDLVTFGSSFNVTDRNIALKESNRILKSGGWFACMWNHRNLEDVHQKAVEEIIKQFIPNYDYGTRRQDQTTVINDSNLFKVVSYVEGDVIHTVSKQEWIQAWKSHATLARQAAEQFTAIVNNIEQYVNSAITEDLIIIPYTTRIWFAQTKK